MKDMPVAYGGCYVTEPLADGVMSLVPKSSAGLPDFYWYNIPKQENVYQTTKNIPIGHEVDQIAVKYSKMTLKYTNIFHSKGLQTIPKFGFLVCNYTFWQPWS
jgi:hypothetical protein